MKGSFNSEAAAIQNPQVPLNCCCQADGALIRISYLQLYCLAARVGLVLNHLPQKKGKGEKWVLLTRDEFRGELWHS